MTITNRRLAREMRALLVAAAAGLATYGMLWHNVTVLLISTLFSCAVVAAVRRLDQR